MRDKKPLWWRIILRLTEVDGVIGFFPAQLLFYLTEEIVPSPNDAGYYKRKLFIHAVVSTSLFILILMILRRVFDWNWRVFPAVLALYMTAIAFAHYERDKELELLTRNAPSKAKQLRLQLRIVKLMVVVWVVFILGMQMITR